MLQLIGWDIERKRDKMSYCRFSSDNWKSDVYVYETDRGFMVDIAANRFVGRIPRTLPINSPNWYKSYLKQSKYVHKAKTVPIGGKFDGGYFLCSTRQELIEKLKMLKRAGYRIPKWVIPDIQKEIAEAGGEREVVKSEKTLKGIK